jgi:hypothetical protein
MYRKESKPMKTIFYLFLWLSVFSLSSCKTIKTKTKAEQDTKAETKVEAQTDVKTDVKTQTVYIDTTKTNKGLEIVIYELSTPQKVSIKNPDSLTAKKITVISETETIKSGVTKTDNIQLKQDVKSKTDAETSTNTKTKVKETTKTDTNNIGFWQIFGIGIFIIIGLAFLFRFGFR